VIASIASSSTSAPLAAFSLPYAVYIAISLSLLLLAPLGFFGGFFGLDLYDYLSARPFARARNYSYLLLYQFELLGLQ